MRLLGITCTNFRSFKGTERFSFPEGPGLYFMQGINLVDPRLGANGAGKSTVWEAILWCLYGKLSNGLKAGDVCNWDVPKGVKVELDFLLDEESTTVWTITRTWGPNSWTLRYEADHITDEETVDLTKDESNFVLGAVRLEFKPFLHCILMAQGEDMFLDLKHDQQATLFSEVMNLDSWMVLSSAASKKASAQDLVTRKYERQLAEIVGQLSSQKDFQGSVEEFEDRRRARLKALERPYADKLAERGKAKRGLDDDKRHEDECRESLRKAVAQMDEAEPIMRKARELIDNAVRAHEGARIAAENATKAVKALKRDEVCQQCGSRMDPEEYGRHLSKLVKLERQALDDLEHSDEAFRKIQKEAATMSEKWERYQSEVRNKLEPALQDAERAVRSTRTWLLTLDKELDRMEEDAEAIEKEVNPFLDVQAKAKEEGVRLRREERETQRALDTSMEKYELYSYWVKGFKELRLSLIAEALTELEIEVNSCVTALGLVGWELQFNVDKETKGGTLQRGFSVQVISPSNKRPTPWEAWSGGEAQRLRIAATMGLSNLIRSRMGCNLNLEVWDEPSQGLSPQGVQDLLESLEHRATQESRQIWIVDHTSYSFGGFAGGATITKTKKGSVIEQY